MSWTISEMSQLTGISADSLRYYDRLDIVSPRRGENGYRHYSERDYIMLQYVAVLKYAHFTLDEIRDIIRSFSLKPSETCNAINRELLISKRKEMQARTKSYRQIIDYIDTVLDLVEDKDAFIANEARLDNLVHDIYESIARFGPES